LATVKLNPTAKNLSEQEYETAFSTGLPSSQTLEVPILDQWPGWWTSLQRGSPASHTPSPASEREQTTNETSGPIPYEPLARWDPDGCCWRTSQVSFLTDTLEPLSGSFPRLGMTADGVLYPLGTLAPHTEETDGGAWRTPAAQEPGIDPERLEGESGHRMYDKETKTQADGSYKPGLRTQASEWRSPSTPTGGADPTSLERGHQQHLQDQVMTWPVASATDLPNKHANIKKWGGLNSLTSMAEETDWPTPRANKVTSVTQEGAQRRLPQRRLEDWAAIDWPTPQERDYRTGQETPHGRGQSNLNDFITTEGPSSHQGPETGEYGKPSSKVNRRLNPLFVTWLMGLPIGWLNLKPLEMESSPSVSPTSSSAYQAWFDTMTTLRIGGIK
jgi:hypothetical protein